MIDYSNIPRDSRRVPLETRVQFKFDRFSGFLSEYSANISPGGMFISTLAPQPPGSVLEFEFRLGDGFELIKGRGEVVWTRAEDEGPTRPAGMGIRFLELSQGSKDLIYRIVDHHILQGGTLFDVTQRPPDPIPIPPPASGAVVSAARTAPPLRFDLPPSPPPGPPATAGPETPADATSWLPALEEPGQEPPAFAPPQEDWLEARDDAWMAGLRPRAEPLPGGPLDAAEPAPAEPPAPMFAASLHGMAKRPRRRMLPWVLVAAVLVLAAGAWFARDALLEMVGLGGSEETASAPVPPSRARTGRPAATPPAAEVTPGPTGLAEDAPAGPEVEVPAVRPGATPAPPNPPPSAAAAPAATGPPATVLEKISSEQAFGGTDIVLQGNGAIRAQGYTRSRIDGNPPRELIRLSGIRSPYPNARVVVGTSEVLQVRTGYHAGNELHVVLDLTHPRVKVTRVEEAGNRLRIHLQRE